LKLGSNSFIPGFESQIVGHKAGEEFDIDVTFPEEYASQELAGQQATFHIKVNDVKREEFPDLNDDFALDVGYESLADMREKLAQKIKETKETNLKDAAKDYILSYLKKNTPIDIAPKQVSEHAARVKTRYEQRLTLSGYNPEEYYQLMRSYNADYDDYYFIRMFLEQAEDEIRTDLILQKIIEKLGIEASEEELQEKYEKYAQEANMELGEFLEKMAETSKEYAQTEIQNEKVYEYLLSVADTENPPIPLEEPEESGGDGALDEQTDADVPSVTPDEAGTPSQTDAEPAAGGEAPSDPE